MKLEIIQKLEDLDRTEDNTVSLWEDIQAKSNEVNKVYFKQELEDFATKRVAVPAALGDIAQCAVLLVLILRTDLRLRGTLGLAGLTNQLDIDSRDSNIPGCTLKLIFFFFSQISPQTYPSYYCCCSGTFCPQASG